MKRVRYIAILLLLTITCRNSMKAQDSLTIPRLMVTTEWLEDHLSGPQLVILHYGNTTGYYEAHIPGARLVAMDRLLVDSENGLRNELPDQATLQNILQSWGINEDSRIVVYYAEKSDLVMACRVLLTLDYAGLYGRIALLNGGLPDWKEENKALTEEVPAIQDGNLKVILNTGMLADRDYILDHIGNDSVIIVDARAEGQFTGRPRDKNATRQGHIKGAINIPFSSLTSEETPYRFSTEAEIRTLFETNAIRPDSRIVTYCGSGILASTVYVAARWLGYDVLFYDGSFQEWGNDESLPVRRGS